MKKFLKEKVTTLVLAFLIVGTLVPSIIFATNNDSETAEEAVETETEIETAEDETEDTASDAEAETDEDITAVTVDSETGEISVEDLTDTLEETEEETSAEEDVETTASEDETETKEETEAETEMSEDEDNAEAETEAEDTVAESETSSANDEEKSTTTEENETDNDKTSEATKTTYVYTDEDIVVTVELDDPADVPDYAVLKADYIEDPSQYLEELNDVIDLEFTTSNTIFYDIYFIYQGNKIEPADTINVSIQYVSNQLAEGYVK